MPIEHDERLTAYALNEMDEAERAEFEVLLAEDEAAREAVADVIAMGDLLVQEFAAEEAPTLSDEQRAALEAQWTGAVAAESSKDKDDATEPAKSPEAQGGKVIRGPWLAAGTMMAMAAALVLVINTGGDIPNPHATAQEAAEVSDKGSGDSPRQSAPAAAAKSQAASARYKKWDKTHKSAEGAKRKGAGNTRRLNDKLASKRDEKKEERGVDYGARLDSAGEFDEETARNEGEPAPPADLAPAGSAVARAPASTPLPASSAPPKAAIGVTGVAKGSPAGFAGPGATVGDDDSKAKARPGRVPGTGGERRLVETETAKPAEPAPAKKTTAKRAGKKLKEKKATIGRYRGLKTGLDGRDFDKDDSKSADRAGWENRVRPSVENPFKSVAAAPLSTFSADVDTASYSNIRKFISRNMAPPPGVVRIEEMINYFPYSYEPPAQNSDHPFAAHVEIAQAPWNAKHRLVRIGIKGRVIAKHKRPSTNLVFLLDVSGSMSNYTKLPLMTYGMKLLVDQLGPDDRVAIVTYAGESGVALKSTNVNAQGRRQILKVINGLEASGSTNGSDGLRLSYEQAVLGFAKGGINRVILASDGDFNVGITNRRKLENLIEAKAKSGVYLTVLGLGMGDFKDGMLEMLADKGSGEDNAQQDGGNLNAIFHWVGV